MTFYKHTLKQAAKRASVEFDRLVTVEALQANCKSQYHAQPRWFVMAYMHATGRYSMPQIARSLQLDDHTTVLHGLRRAHGYDGKYLNREKPIKPLWKKEQFQNMVIYDGTALKLPPQPYEKVNAEQINAIGIANLARYKGAA